MAEKRQKQKRGAYSRSESVFVGAWIPVALADAMDRAIARLDTDRSKLLRLAVAEKLREES